MLHLILILNTMKILIEKISNLKLVIASEYHKNIFAKGYTQNWSKVFVISKLKNTVLWTYNSSDLSGKLIDGAFYEIELQKTNQEEFRIEKVIKKKKMTNCMSNGKDMIVHLMVGLIKKTVYKHESILS